MKRILLFVILTLLSGNAFAIEAGKIAVVNMQRLIDLSTAASDIKEQAKKDRDAYQAMISKEEDVLRKEEAKLAEQRNILKQEVFAEKSRVFKDKVAKIQRDFQEKRAAQENALNQALGQVNKVIYDIIESLSIEESFDIAIPSAQILYGAPALDITDKVLARLNNKLPTLKLSYDKPDSAESKPNKSKAK